MESSYAATHAHKHRATAGSFWDVLKQAASEFIADGAMTQAAAISFYTLFSLAPLLVVLIAIAGFVWDPNEVRGQLVDQTQDIIGPDSAGMLEQVIANASARRGSGIFATVIGGITLLLGALGVFGQLKNALNVIWDVELKPGRGILGVVIDRVLSFAMVLVIAFLLLVSLVASTVIAAAGQAFEAYVPLPSAAMQAINFIVSFGVITLLFAAMFKILPDVRMRWGIVWLGAITTALLFSVGKHLIGLYLGQTGTSSVYGAAGSLALLLIWVYYSTMIFLAGAEVTQVWARHRGEQIVPDKDARWIGSSDTARPSMPATRPGRSRSWESSSAPLCDDGRLADPVFTRAAADARRRSASPRVAMLTTLAWATARAWVADQYRTTRPSGR